MLFLATFAALLVPPACPAGFVRLDAREVAPFTVCAGDTREAGVTPAGVLLLPRELRGTAAAARAAHLAHHMRSGSPLAPGALGGDCARWTEAALDEEREARALEESLGGDPARFAPDMRRLARDYAARCTRGAP